MLTMQNGKNDGHREEMAIKYENNQESGCLYKQKARED